MTNVPRKGFVLACLFVVLWGRPAAPQHPAQYVCLTLDRVEDRAVVTEQGAWRYRPGDDPGWADPSLDDADWEVVDPVMADGGYPAGGWQGIGWFRLHVDVDSTLWGRPVGLTFRQTGASEIYLDGRRLFVLGRVGRTIQDEKTQYQSLRPPLPISFDAGRHHVLAVRYSNHGQERTKRFPDTPAGFIATFGDLLQAEAAIAKEARQIVSYQMFFTGVPLAFSLLHLLLFLFYRRHRENLYFSITSLFMAGLTYVAFRNYFIDDVQIWFANYGWFKFTLVGLSVAGIYFVYSLFHSKPPRHGWVILGGGVVLVLVCRWVSHNYAYFFAFIALAEQLRVISISVKNRRDGAWIIGLGFLAFTLGGSYQMLTGMGYIPLFIDTDYAYLWGFMGLLLFMSVYLARQFARIHLSLEHQIEQVKELSVKAVEQERQAQEQQVERVRLEEENKRRTQELEEARKLQQAEQELKNTQAQLMQAEKMSSLGMLVAGVAHDINTPVGAIASTHNTIVRAIERLKSMLGGGETDERLSPEKLFKIIEEGNRVIASGTERVTNIVQRLKSFARLDEAELKKVDIHEGLEDTLTIVHHELKHKAEVERNYGDIPSIACYPGQLNQVYLNLLMNAVQAIEEKGTVTISTFLRDDRVHIQIADTGTGIPEESLRRIFDPFYTTKKAGVGTGLGLSICYQIVQDHHGEIRVES